RRTEAARSCRSNWRSLLRTRRFSFKGRGLHRDVSNEVRQSLANGREPGTAVVGQAFLPVEPFNPGRRERLSCNSRGAWIARFRITIFLETARLARLKRRSRPGD